MSSKNHDLPDITNEVRAPVSGQLDRVGMSKIEVGIKYDAGDMGQLLIPGFAKAFVNIVDPDAKGIHMSRLFLNLHEGLQSASLSGDLLDRVAHEFLQSHQKTSDSAYVAVDFQIPINRKALLSENFALRHYSAKMALKKSPKENYTEVQVIVPYSSTCPCSAALARQLIQQEFLKDFGKDSKVDVEAVSQWLRKDSSILATPHSQRSYATVGLRFENPGQAITHKNLIDLIEDALKTPVQAVVKREDEQEFARLNGGNLMFCEDSGRRLKFAVSKVPHLFDYKIQVSHEESLHPHDAVSSVSGGKSSDWSF